MMIATVAGGAFMYAVHKAAKQMPKEEYSVFTTLVQFITLMDVPAIGLQTRQKAPLGVIQSLVLIPLFFASEERGKGVRRPHEASVNSKSSLSFIP